MSRKDPDGVATNDLIHLAHVGQNSEIFARSCSFTSLMVSALPT